MKLSLPKGSMVILLHFGIEMDILLHFGTKMQLKVYKCMESVLGNSRQEGLDTKGFKIKHNNEINLKIKTI